MRQIRVFVAMLIAVFSLLSSVDATAQTEERLRVGVLKFGTVNWQLDSLQTHRFDVAENLRVEVLPLATKNATSVALQAGEVDMIVSDWIWVLRQRNAGAEYLFAPYSTGLGALVLAPSDDKIEGIQDLSGKRVGVAGGPIDKSWLVLRTWTRHHLDLDISHTAEPVFAAPPLLNEQLRVGELDAVLTFWPYAARLEAQGFARFVDVADLLADLGIERSPALVGYVFREDLAREKPEAVRGFFKAIGTTNALLASSEEEWERLRPLMKAGSEREFDALKAGFRAGIPAAMDEKGLTDVQKLYQLLSDIGGQELVGQGTRFDPDAFWDPQVR